MDAVGSPRPVSRRKCCGGGAGWLILLVPAFLLFGPYQPGWLSWPGQKSAPRVQRAYDLVPAKAAALHHLLAPRDVRVLVSWSESRVSVKGTEREVEILDRFVALLNRVDCCNAACVSAHMDKARRTWTTSRNYKLSRGKGAALFNILAFDDVPVLVSGSKSKICVQASPDDQKTIWHVVNILKGQRRP